MVDESTTPDGELLRAHLAGDATAFATLVRRHQTWMWATARAMLGNREDALDAVQQALIRAFRSAHTWRGDGSVTSWLHRIVARVTLDVYAELPPVRRSPRYLWRSGWVRRWASSYSSGESPSSPAWMRLGLYQPSM